MVQLSSSTAGASLEAVRAVDPGWKVQPYASYYTDKANKEKQRHHSSQTNAQKGQAAEPSSSSRQQQQQQGMDSDSNAGDSAGPPSSSSKTLSQGSPRRAKMDRDAPNRASNGKAILPTGKSSSLPQSTKEAGESVDMATLPQGGNARVPAPSDEAFRALGDRLRELPASLGSPRQGPASDPDSSSALQRPGHKSE